MEQKIDFSKIDPKKTAVVVVDVQSEFCSMEGFGARNWGHDVSHFDDVIVKMKEFLEEAKKFNLEILYTQLIYDPNKMSKALIKKLGPFVGKFASPGSEAINFYKINPPKEKVFVKYGFSAFTNKDFELYLRNNKIENLILIGFNSNICVESTARQAIDLGFYPVILNDLVGTPTFIQNHEKETLFLFNTLFGDVLPSKEVVNLWRKNEN